MCNLPLSDGFSNVVLSSVLFATLSGMLNFHKTRREQTLHTNTISWYSIARTLIVQLHLRGQFAIGLTPAFGLSVAKNGSHICYSRWHGRYTPCASSS